MLPVVDLQRFTFHRSGKGFCLCLVKMARKEFTQGCLQISPHYQKRVHPYSQRMVKMNPQQKSQSIDLGRGQVCVVSSLKAELRHCSEGRRRNVKGLQGPISRGEGDPTPVTMRRDLKWRCGPVTYP